MQLFPFDEDSRHRVLVPYDERYPGIFESVARLVEDAIPHVSMHHIGSTAIPDLSGKPMLDSIAVTKRDLRETQKEFVALGFHGRDVWVDRDDKPYVCCSVNDRGSVFNFNVHICHPGDGTHLDLLAFRDLLRQRKDLREEYEQAKIRAHEVDPKNPEIYNKAKEPIIGEIMRVINAGR